MELRRFALNLLFTPTLDARLAFPDTGRRAFVDHHPGLPMAWQTPQRPPELQIAPKRARRPLPSPLALGDPAMRIRCLHTFANHELMALELMAWALLAYPTAPGAFRQGLAWLIEEEQGHLRLYIERLGELGVAFGDLPLNDHFWRIAPQLATPLQWVCAMNLTFEQANLDHAPDFAHHFEAAGDEPSARLMRQIAHDEIKHVGFGLRWLRAFSADSGQTDWEVFVGNLTAYNDPTRARGARFEVGARVQAGLEPEFIARLKDVAG